ASVELFFETFRRLGSASAVVKYFRTHALHFPRRVRTGSRRGEMVFPPLVHSRAIRMLHSPRYAGAFAYGRSRVRRKPEGGVRIQTLPRQEWQVLIPDAHEGYIIWAEYEANVQRLHEAARARGQDRRWSPPREGPALLQGLAVCGICGERMTTQYHVRDDGTRLPRYVCQLRRLQRGEPRCQSVAGRELDQAIGELLIETMTPLSLELALSVADELRARAEEVDRLRRHEIEHARYEADLAERRYRRVDPDHRLVADALEADWNEKLRALADAHAQYAQQSATDQKQLDDDRRQEILRLATDVPRLWRDPRTPDREKKRIAQFLIEDVTLIRDHGLTAHVRFKGGATRTLTLPRSRSAPDLRRTDAELVERIDQLLTHHTEAEVLELLNAKGCRTGTGLPFTRARLYDLRMRHHLKNRYDRLRARGFWTLGEMAKHLGVVPSTVQRWYAAGLFKAHACGSHRRSQRLYEPPGLNPPRPQQGKKLLHTPTQP
ncbi:MAG: recombinase family protein, partial [Candidatus Rokuibacteriota bacterium]